MNVEKLGERKLIDIIHKIITKNWSKPNYDDAVLCKSPSSDQLLIHTDVFNESSDLLPNMDLYSFGWKATIANLSDIAVKGAKPLGILFSISLPPHVTYKNFKKLINGICDASKNNFAKYLGGDLSSGIELSLAGFSFGFTKRFIPRSGAKVGDLIGITGYFGITSIAFKILMNNLQVEKEVRSFFIKNVYRPKGRIKESISISHLINSSMDVSDGLALSLHQLCKQSKIGAKIYNIPIHPRVKKICDKNNLDPLSIALYEGGEEYEIVFTFDERNLELIRKTLNSFNCNFTIIGKTTKEKNIIYEDKTTYFPIENRGWEHFKYR